MLSTCTALDIHEAIFVIEEALKTSSVKHMTLEEFNETLKQELKLRYTCKDAEEYCSKSRN